MKPQQQFGEALRNWARTLEQDDRLDRYVESLQSLVGVIDRSDSWRDMLRGRWLGHSLHPLLTDFPLGAWLSASFLDLFGGDDARPAAETLVAFGLATAVPTALAGAADWSTADRPSKRVGAVHVGLNGAVAGLYACSLIARRKRRHALAVALGVGGGIIAWASGYLGGHLSLVRGVVPSMHSRHEDIENPSD